MIPLQQATTAFDTLLDLYFLQDDYVISVVMIAKVIIWSRLQKSIDNFWGNIQRDDFYRIIEILGKFCLNFMKKKKYEAYVFINKNWV